MKKYFLISIPILMLAGVAGVYFAKTSATICPDDFNTSEESAAAFDQWAKEYSDTHPGAQIADMTAARREFYVQHHCTAALARFDGNVSQSTKDAVESLQQETEMK